MFDWKKFFNIRIDSAPADELRDRIESDSTVTGANLVILIAAILIACVGLNMDSTAVIIGAMLISLSWADLSQSPTAWRHITCTS